MEKVMWWKIIGAVVLVVLVSFITVKLTMPKAGSNNVASVYDKVVNSGVIRACYIPYPPQFIKDPNTGKLSGIFYDALTKAADNMALKVDWNAEIDWGSIVQNLNSGKCDIVGSGIWANSTRGKSAEFSVPLIYSAINAYVRSNDNRFNADPLIANDPKYTVVYLDGETSQVVATNQFPNAKKVSLPQTDDVSLMLLNVISNKADMAFVEPSIAEQFLKTHPGAIKNVSVSQPLIVYGNAVVMQKGQFELQTMINNSFNELLNSGYINQLLDKYSKDYPGGFYKIAPPYTVSQ